MKFPVHALALALVLTLVASLLLFADATWAQPTAPTTTNAAPAGIDLAPARHQCPKPAVPLASRKPEPAEMNAFVASLDAFRDCVQSFAQAQQRLAEVHQRNADALNKAAQAAVAAGNAAIKEYNELAEQATKAFNTKSQ